MQKFKSPLEAFLYWEKIIPNNIFLNQPVNGKIITYSFKQAGEESRKIAAYLKTLNLPERSHIALMSKNCAHWHMSDLAIMMAGYISVPIYPTLNASTIEDILTHSESKLLIAGKLDDFNSQKSGTLNLPIISVGLYGLNEGKQWEDIVLNESVIQDVYNQHPDDLHTIIYTSGTTGMPKGVMHTVGSFVESSYCLSSTFQINNHFNAFSYLPIAHVAERVLETGCILTGSQVSFPESIETFAADLERVQPDVYFAVPRIWTKFQEKILEKIPQEKLNTLLKIPFVNGLIKKKLQKKLGLSKAKVILSGAAPIAPSLINWYKTIGIHVLQVYGMTEDCCVSHWNTGKNNKTGTVGKAVEGVSVKFSEVGEICIKNNCMFKGYFKAPEITAEVFDDDGFFKTGDIGEYDHDGFLTITGRVKDQFKTDKGKYISPSNLELALSKNSSIEQICVVGTGIPQPIALITLSENGKVLSKDQLSKDLIKTVNDVNSAFEKHEKIEKVVVMKEEWKVDNGLITPTLKVKRNAIEKIHQPYYKQWFDTSEKVIFE